MNVLSHISDIIIPLLLFYIIGYGLVSKVKVYEAFLAGAREGLKVVVDIMPTLVGLLVSILMSCTESVLILRGSEEYLQRQDLEFVPIFYTSPVVLDLQY